MRVLSMLLIPVFALSSAFLTFDTRNGISIGYGFENVDVYTGYRFTGLDFKTGFGPLIMRFGTSVDPFDVQVKMIGSAGLDFDVFKIEMIGSFNYWDVSQATQMTQSGLVEAGVSLGLKIGDFSFNLLASFSPVALVYYPEEEEIKFHFLYPPIDPQDVVMNSHVLTSFGLDLGDFEVSIGYEIRFGFVAGVPGPLMDMNGIFFRVRMENLKLRNPR